MKVNIKRQDLSEICANSFLIFRANTSVKFEKHLQLFSDTGPEAQSSKAEAVGKNFYTSYHPALIRMASPDKTSDINASGERSSPGLFEPFTLCHAHTDSQRAQVSYLFLHSRSPIFSESFRLRFETRFISFFCLILA